MNIKIFVGICIMLIMPVIAFAAGYIVVYDGPEGRLTFDPQSIQHTIGKGNVAVTQGVYSYENKRGRVKIHTGVIRDADLVVWVTRECIGENGGQLVCKDLGTSYAFGKGERHPAYEKLFQAMVDYPSAK